MNGPGPEVERAMKHKWVEKLGRGVRCHSCERCGILRVGGRYYLDRDEVAIGDALYGKRSLPRLVQDLRRFKAFTYKTAPDCAIVVVTNVLDE